MPDEVTDSPAGPAEPPATSTDAPASDPEPLSSAHERPLTSELRQWASSRQGSSSSPSSSAALPPSSDAGPAAEADAGGPSSASEPGPSVDLSASFELRLKTLENDMHPLSVTGATRVSELKALAAPEVGLPPERQRLVFGAHRPISPSPHLRPARPVPASRPASPTPAHAMLPPWPPARPPTHTSPAHPRLPRTAGKVLRDEQPLSSYKLSDGDVVHVVARPEAAASSTSNDEPSHTPLSSSASAAPPLAGPSPGWGVAAGLPAAQHGQGRATPLPGHSVLLGTFSLPGGGGGTAELPQALTAMLQGIGLQVRIRPGCVFE